MEVRHITDRQAWQSFVDAAHPHTFLDSWSWGEFETANGHPSWRLGAYDEGPTNGKTGTLVGVVLVSKIVARRATYLVWHHGPVVAPGASPATVAAVLAACTAESAAIARKEGCHFIRASSILEDTAENRALFAAQGFRPAPVHLHSELSWLLDLALSEDDLLKGMRKNTRYAIKKAEKDGVTIEKVESMDGFDRFWDIYMETVKRQSFTPYPRHYLMNEFKTFLDAGEAAIFFASYQGTAIATAFIVYTRDSGFYHHGASIHPFPGISGAELLQWEAIREARRRGCREHNFWGVVPEEATKHPWYGLSRFKRGFGGRELALVHAQDLPVNPGRYWLNYLLERYRTMRRGLS